MDRPFRSTPRRATRALVALAAILLLAPVGGLGVAPVRAAGLSLPNAFTMYSFSFQGDCQPDGTTFTFASHGRDVTLPGAWGMGDQDLEGTVTLGTLAPASVVAAVPYTDGIPGAAVTSMAVSFSAHSAAGSLEVTLTPRAAPVSQGWCGSADDVDYTEVAPTLPWAAATDVRWKSVHLWFDFVAIVREADGTATRYTGYSDMGVADTEMSGAGGGNYQHSANISFFPSSSEPLPIPETCDNGVDDDADGATDSDDLGCPPSITVRGNTLPEGDNGDTEMPLPLQLSHATSVPVEITCVIEQNTARSPEDFSPITQRVTIPAGETEGQCIVLIVGDKVDESSEIFRIHLSDPVNAVHTPPPFVIGGTIVNDDDPYIRIDNALDVPEGDSGTTSPMRFPLTLSNPSVNQPAQVTCVAQDMSATFPEDYRPASVTVVIPPGEIEAECVFEVVGDDEVEVGGQRVQVYLSDLSRAQLGGDEAYGSIVDDDTDEPPLPDTEPPVVVAVPDRAPNGRGWYREPVTIDWRATDPDPSSGTPSDPADTVVSAEGRAMTITSEVSCDPAGNCATGTIDISLDSTDPLLSAHPLDLPTMGDTDPVAAEGEPFTLTVDAEDSLSGVVLVEWFVDDADPGRGNASAMTPDGGRFTATITGLDRGHHILRIRARDAAGNWSQIERVPVRVTAIRPATACSLLQDASERDNVIQLLDEQGDDTATLCTDLPVDIEAGSFGPALTASRAPGLRPGVIPAGTTVRSFLVHADRAYRISENGDYLVRRVILDFEGGTVLGAVVRDATLKRTDVLGASGTRLQPGLAYRGHEVNLLSGGVVLNPDDALAIRADRQRVIITLQVGEAMDEVRIITTAGASLAPTSTGFVVEAPPRSLRQDDFDTEHCPASPPNQANCTVTAPSQTGDDVAVIWEQQVHPVRLDKALAVDIAGDGTWTRADWSSKRAYAPIPAGTRIRSVILHVDRVGAVDSFRDGDFVYVGGSHTFAREILGVIVSDATLDASDLLAAPGRLMPTGYADRGLDFGLVGPQYANDERVTISPDRHTITVVSHIANGLDQLRVILGQ